MNPEEFRRQMDSLQYQMVPRELRLMVLRYRLGIEPYNLQGIRAVADYCLWLRRMHGVDVTEEYLYAVNLLDPAIVNAVEKLIRRPSGK